ncbi:MAG: hypothetical protein AABZ78_14605 [Chloroflexota bacterium]
MKYVRVLILLLMAIALVFRVEGVWALFTAALLVTLNAPMMMIVTAAMVIGLLEAFAWLYADYVLFHLLVYVASIVAVLLGLMNLTEPDRTRRVMRRLLPNLTDGESPVMQRIRRGVETMASGDMAEDKLKRLEAFVDSLLEEEKRETDDSESEKS